MGAKVSSVFSAAQIRGFQWWSNYCGCPEPQNPPGCGGQTENGIDFCALVDDGVATPCGYYNSWFEDGCLARPSPPPICYGFDWCVQSEEDGLYYFYINFTNV